MREDSPAGRRMREIERERQSMPPGNRAGSGVQRARALQAEEDELVLEAYGAPTAEERTQAEGRYFGAQGTTKEQVSAERILTEANRIYTVQELRNGRPAVVLQGRSIPAVRVSAGKMRGTMPRPETVEQAMLLIRSGSPFAVDRNGKPVPVPSIKDDPRIKAAVANPNKTIGAGKGAAQSNIGAQAVFSYAMENFGYLGRAKAEQIAQQLLFGELKYQLTGDV